MIFIELAPAVLAPWSGSQAVSAASFGTTMRCPKRSAGISPRCMAP